MERDAHLRDAVQAEDWTATETSLRRTLLDVPGGEWSVTKLQDVYKTDRLPSLKEILSVIFGYSTGIATRSQLADQEFERFVATSDVNAVNSRDLRKLFESFVLDEDARSLLVGGQFGQLRTRDPTLFSSVQRLPAEEREALVEYVKARVPLNQFAAV